MTTEIQTSMLPYQQWVFESICKFSRITGTNVLEIGGTPQMIGIASHLIQKGASTVLQINNRRDLKDNVEEQLQYRRMDARQIDYPDASFDISFSASVLEHLLDMDDVLDELFRVTRPGGLVCLHGGAFWNSRWGHHLWVLIDGERFAFNGNNPLPDWSHLYFDRNEMTDYLSQQGLPAEHVEIMVKWVYDSEEINRLTYDNLAEKFNRSKFDLVALEPKDWKVPDEALANKLFALHGNKISNYTIGEAVVVMRKPFATN